MKHSIHLMLWASAGLLVNQVAAGKPCVSALSTNLLPLHMDAINEAIKLIKESYEYEVFHSNISHHKFIPTAPPALQDALSQFVWSEETISLLTQPGDSPKRFLTDSFQEIYIMRPEFDLIDKEKWHYDGVLNVPGICAVRALIYLTGPEATLVAATSRSNFTTAGGTAILFDFNRELHAAKLEDNASNEPRILIKATMHIIDDTTPHVRVALQLGLHRFIRFLNKSLRATLEANSENRAQQIIMMFLGNIFRSLLRIHMALPFTLGALPIFWTLISVVWYPRKFFPYVIFICLMVKLENVPTYVFRSMAAGWLVSHINQFAKSPMILHFVWTGLVTYMAMHCDLIRHIVFAPMPLW